MIFPKPCVKCGTVFTAKGDYCPTHRAEVNRAREANPERKARKARLYNSIYKQQAKLIKEQATHCHLCQQPFTDRSEITADHILPGNELSPLAPAHKSCNSSRGNKPL